MMRTVIIDRSKLFLLTWFQERLPKRIVWEQNMGAAGMEVKQKIMLAPQLMGAQVSTAV